jgi:hypothetical protein
MTSDLRERLEELAEAAASHGRTPGPQAALRRGRRRQWRLAVGRSALMALVLVAVVVAGNQLTSPTGPLGTPATTRPAEVTASSRYGPDVSFRPSRVRSCARPVLLPAGTARAWSGPWAAS